MTPLDLAEGQRLLAEATPGPWEQRERKINSADTRQLVCTAEGEPVAEIEKWGEVADKADAALIVFAVNHLPAFLSAAREREAMEAVVEAARDWREHYERGKVPAGTPAKQEAWMAEEEPVAEALSASVARLDEVGQG